jgi:hypothetical protein
LAKSSLELVFLLWQADALRLSLFLLQPFVRQLFESFLLVEILLEKVGNMQALPCQSSIFFT